jgi:hypothetical protein
VYLATTYFAIVRNPRHLGRLKRPTNKFESQCELGCVSLTDSDSRSQLDLSVTPLTELAASPTSPADPPVPLSPFSPTLPPASSPGAGQRPLVTYESGPQLFLKCIQSTPMLRAGDRTLQFGKYSHGIDQHEQIQNRLVCTNTEHAGLNKYRPVVQSCHPGRNSGRAKLSQIGLARGGRVIICPFKWIQTICGIGRTCATSYMMVSMLRICMLLPKPTFPQMHVKQVANGGKGNNK